MKYCVKQAVLYAFPMPLETQRPRAFSMSGKLTALRLLTPTKKTLSLLTPPAFELAAADADKEDAVNAAAAEF